MVKPVQPIDAVSYFLHVNKSDNAVSILLLK